MYEGEVFFGAQGVFDERHSAVMRTHPGRQAAAESGLAQSTARRQRGKASSFPHPGGVTPSQPKSCPAAPVKIEQFFDSLRGTLALVPIFIALVRRTMSCEKARMLIVDDSQLIRTSISHLLAEIGYSVRSAQDGFSALRELREEMPDILLSDLNMPGMSGYELLRVVRHRFPTIHVIAMSGAFSGNEVPSGVAADAFYQKGSSMGALLRIIESLPPMERRDPLPVRIAAPLLIQRNESDTFREAHVMIACSECLRTFPQPIYGSGSLERTTNCIYCGSSIQYSVVEPLNQMPLRSYDRRAGAEISAQGVSDVGD
jgi:CheY-like chemotaxis protein